MPLRVRDGPFEVGHDVPERVELVFGGEAVVGDVPAYDCGLRSFQRDSSSRFDENVGGRGERTFHSVRNDRFDYGALHDLPAGDVRIITFSVRIILHLSNLTLIRPFLLVDEGLFFPLQLVSLRK